MHKDQVQEIRLTYCYTLILIMPLDKCKWGFTLYIRYSNHILLLQYIYYFQISNIGSFYVATRMWFILYIKYDTSSFYCYNE